MSVTQDVINTTEDVINNTKLLAKIFNNSLYKSAFEKGSSSNQYKIDELKKLKELEIDPLIFEITLTNEMNRGLKEKYASRFIWLTVLFTLISYTIVILNGNMKWQIPDATITALIIEIPLQFIGILYIIARNLFPSSISTK